MRSKLNGLGGEEAFAAPQRLSEFPFSSPVRSLSRRRQLLPS